MNRRFSSLAPAGTMATTGWAGEQVSSRGGEMDSSPTGADGQQLERACAYCMRLIDEKARSFSFAAHFLPERTRRDVAALYAFCRTVDDIADLPEGRSVEETRAQLD